MGKDRRFVLCRDRRGMFWDLLLYVPTVLALATTAALFWYRDESSLAYLLSFLASFFAIVGANRVLRTRLLLLPGAAVAIEVAGEVARIERRDGGRLDLMKQIRIFRDLSGKSFGLTGLDGQGSKQQLVFHQGQFETLEQFSELLSLLDRIAVKPKT